MNGCMLRVVYLQSVISLSIHYHDNGKQQQQQRGLWEGRCRDYPILDAESIEHEAEETEETNDAAAANPSNKRLFSCVDLLSH